MKALKEKRIGFRSLLRRGLVILSLFALVFAFASCADSDGDDDTSQPPITNTDPPVSKGTVPARIEIISWPVNDQYEGLPLDLTGLKIRVFASDNPKNNWTVAWEEQKDKFYTNPPYAVGVIGQTSTGTDLVWLPQLQYDLTWITAYGNPLSPISSATQNAQVLDLQDTDSVAVKAAGTDTLLLKNLPTVVPIMRAAVWTDIETSDPRYVYDSVKDVYNWSKGLRFTTKDYNQKVYVDDNPTLSKYTLEAEYYPVTKEKERGGKIKPFALDQTTEWRIVPDYKYRATDTVRANPIGATGDLLVTVGTNPLPATDPKVLAALVGTGSIASPQYKAPTSGLSPGNVRKDNPIDPGLTIRHTYEDVYIVESIKVTTELELEPFYYWQEDTAAAWLERLVAAKGKITVNYKGLTGTPAPKEFTPQQLSEQNRVWYNTLFGTDYPTNDIDSSLTPDDAMKSKEPFAVMAIQESDPTHRAHAKNRDPMITIKYRGAPAYIETPVLTRLAEFTIDPLTGDEVGKILYMGRDNDVGNTNALWFGASKVKGYVAYTAYSDPEYKKGFEVYMSPVPGADLVDKATYRPSVTFDALGTTGMVGAKGAGDPGDVSQAEYYSNNYYDLTHNTKNNGKAVSVRFYYAAPDCNDTTVCTWAFANWAVTPAAQTWADRAGVATRRMGAQVQVTFENITGQ